jgi:Ser/Thr protein kinase RdoA (MazF antagonist)
MELTPELVEATWPVTSVTRLAELQYTASGDRAVYLVEGAAGTFVAKRASSWLDREGLDRSLDVFDALPARGFSSIPRLVRTRAGERFSERDGRFVHLLTHVDGATPGRTPETYAKFGALVAELHSVDDYPRDTAFDPNRLATTDLEELAGSLRFGDEYRALLRTLPRFGSLPRAVIHADVNTGNTIERPDGTLVLLDLDDVGNGPRVLDVGFPLINQFVTEDSIYRSELATAFYDAYTARIRLTCEELMHVFPAALFIALMYLPFGDRERRWRRIRWALEHRAELEARFL